MRPVALTTLLFTAALLLCATVAEACPTCKDQLAADPAAYNIARGYFWSILFMLSMPPLILAGLGSYFYWEIRRAYAKQALEESLPGEENPLVSMQR
jgi:heme/copper-type cytochrome/quinol oxidase subunit 2